MIVKLNSYSYEEITTTQTLLATIDNVAYLPCNNEQGSCTDV